ncbi:hypothetical protein [Paenibacillus sp. FSL H8-0034]|uniref:hypothetical protein n=1 Tax=Paenibacillus sp. FSL H8-0034 TaxID=2954671 RepID=UPI0030F93E2B
MSDKVIGKYSLLPLGGLLLPIVLHSIHLLLPVLMAGSASLNSGHSHAQHQGMTGTMVPFTMTPWFTNTLSLITIVSAVFTLWYLIRLWKNKAYSRRWAWFYTGLSVVCFGLMAAL